MQFPYLFTLIIFILLPTVVLWIFNWQSFFPSIKLFIFVGACSLIWGFLFDIVGSVEWGIWFYRNTLGINLLGLPLEEYMTLLLFPQFVTALMLLIRRKWYV